MRFALAASGLDGGASMVATLQIVRSAEFVPVVLPASVGFVACGLAESVACAESPECDKRSAACHADVVADGPAVDWVTQTSLNSVRRVQV